MPDKNKTNPLDPVVVQQFLALVKDQYDREIDRVNEKIDQRFDDIVARIDATGKERKDQIETVEGKVNKKLDAVDEALRGNGRIGIFEQMRSVRNQLKALFLLVALLFGLKVWGMGLDEWIKDFFIPEVKKSLVEPATRPATRPTG